MDEARSAEPAVASTPCGKRPRDELLRECERGSNSSAKQQRRAGDATTSCSSMESFLLDEIVRRTLFPYLDDTSCALLARTSSSLRRAHREECGRTMMHFGRTQRARATFFHSYFAEHSAAVALSTPSLRHWLCMVLGEDIDTNKKVACTLAAHGFASSLREALLSLTPQSFATDVLLMTVMVGAECGWVDVVKTLLELTRSGQVHWWAIDIDKLKMKVMRKAASNNHCAVLDALGEAGTTVHDNDRCSTMPLYRIALRNNALDSFEWARCRTPVGIRSRDDKALKDACALVRYHDVCVVKGVVQKLIDGGCPATSKAVKHASIHGSTEMICWLLHEKRIVARPSAAAAAARHGQLETLKLLHRHGVPLNVALGATHVERSKVCPRASPEQLDRCIEWMRSQL